MDRRKFIKLAAPALIGFAVPPLVRAQTLTLLGGGKGAISAASYTGPGDVISGAIAWWGLRAYSAAKIGNNVVKLRRDSDNTTQDFVSLSTGALDVASITTFKGAANLFVHTIHDQIAGTYNQVQTTNATQIPFTLSGLGSLPILDPASGKRFTAIAGPTQSQPYTLVAVCNRDTATGTDQYILTSQAGGTDAVNIHNTTVSNQFMATAGTPGVVTANDSAWNRYAFTANGASGHVYVNGTDTGAVNYGSTGLSGNLVLLTEVFNVDFQGKFVEAGIWPQAFSGANATAMASNQATYWGI